MPPVRLLSGCWAAADPRQSLCTSDVSLSLLHQHMCCMPHAWTIVTQTLSRVVCCQAHVRPQGSAVAVLDRLCRRRLVWAPSSKPTSRHQLLLPPTCWSTGRPMLCMGDTPQGYKTAAPQGKAGFLALKQCLSCRVLPSDPMDLYSKGPCTHQSPQGRPLRRWQPFASTAPGSAMVLLRGGPGAL